jgi:nucleotide-binding universal stress UspA family protein
MTDTVNGVAARLNFAKGGRESSWRRKGLSPGADGAKRTVASVLEALAARPDFEVDGARYGGLVELRGPASAEAVADVETLALSAAESGAHAELAVFPLEGDFPCRVWDARKEKWVERPPDAREVQGDFRFFQKKLREVVGPRKKGPDVELERRTKLLQEASRWPALFPVAGTQKDLGYWFGSILGSAGPEDRPVLERFGREYAKQALELAREIDSSDMKWGAAARAVGLSPDDLHSFRSGLAVPLALTSKDWRKQLELKGRELTPVMEALGRIAPEEVPAEERKELLKNARERARRDTLRLGEWFETSQRLGGPPLEELMREALELGVKPGAEQSAWGFAEFAQQVFTWHCAPEEVPILYPLERQEVLAALEAMVKAGLPSGFQKRIQAAAEAVPPFGMEPRKAWALTPRMVAKPVLPCETCGAKMKPKAELAIAPLSEKHGARTVRVYECDACAEEEPSEEYVRLTVEDGVPRGAPEPQPFDDYPDAAEGVRSGALPRFMQPRYREFLEQQGLGLKEHPVQLEGYEHGFGEDVRIGVSCRHKATLLQFSALALGLKLRQLRVAAEVCLKAGCKRPGISDEVAAS